MWFFKGEIESAMAEKGETDAPPAEEDVDASELAQKYSDDGSMDEDQARRLSLRTGKTQGMQAVRVPSGALPGERMDAEDFIGEMNRGRRIAIWLGIAILIAAVAGTVIYFVF